MVLFDRLDDDVLAVIVSITRRIYRLSCMGQGANHSFLAKCTQYMHNSSSLFVKWNSNTSLIVIIL